MRRSRAGLLIGLAFFLQASRARPSPSASAAEPTAAPSDTGSAIESVEPTPTASPEPEALSLDLPGETDDRVVAVTVDPQIDAEGGEIVVTVTSESAEMIEELVLRWPRELNRTLFLRPFELSEQRIADGGPPLVQEWTNGCSDREKRASPPAPSHSAGDR